jgi:hypothetical protein
MARTSNQEQQNNTSLVAQQSDNNKQKGIVTVNDENNPSPEERDALIPKESDTKRLRSERQSAQEGKRTE